MIRLRDDESGFTIIELVVVTGLLGTVLAMAFGAIASFQSAIVTSDTRSQTNDQARLAVEQIDRQVRSGNVLYDPSNEGSNAGTNPDGSAIPAGFSMRIYTQANGVERCVQWRVLNTQVLQKRAWSQAWRDDGQVSGWRTVATGIVNSTLQKPFSLDSAVAFGGPGPSPSPGVQNNSRLVNIDIIANVNSNHGSNVEYTNSAEGRNTQYFAPNSGLCTDIPTQ